MTCVCMRSCSCSAVRRPSRSGAGPNWVSAGSNMESSGGFATVHFHHESYDDLAGLEPMILRAQSTHHDILHVVPEAFCLLARAKDHGRNGVLAPCARRLVEEEEI